MELTNIEPNTKQNANNNFQHEAKIHTVHMQIMTQMIMMMTVDENQPKSMLITKKFAEKRQPF